MTAEKKPDGIFLKEKCVGCPCADSKTGKCLKDPNSHEGIGGLPPLENFSELKPKLNLRGDEGRRLAEFG